MRKLLSIPLGPFLMGLCWLGLACLVFRDIASMSAAEAGGMGPGTYPKILAVGLTLLVLVYWFQSRRKKAASISEPSKTADVVKSACLVLLAFAAAYLWEMVGALPILLVLSIIELKWLEGYGWIKVVTVSLILSIGVWLVFTVLLGVSLPLGLLLMFY
ncbi:MAG: tripartite tricarboxylate transporter TctB family protein [Syntrophales bacterium]|nr:tripartite tricarboxylate transporter TctB family protein [Syntrophales bacterium]